MRGAALMAWTELKLFVRDPFTVLFVLVLPAVILYVLNGVFGSQPSDPTVWQGMDAVDFYSSAYVVLVSATVGVLTVPVHLAAYREQGVLRRFRASAVPPLALVAAHVAVGTLLATAGAVIVTLTSVLAYDAAAPADLLGTVAAHLLVAVSFAVLGTLLGLVLPTARAAQGLGVLLFFVFMMLGGAGPPSEVLPTGLRRIGATLPVTPATDLIRSVWFADGWPVRGVVTLGAVMVGAGLLSTWVLRHEEAR